MKYAGVAVHQLLCYEPLRINLSGQGNTTIRILCFIQFKILVPLLGQLRLAVLSEESRHFGLLKVLLIQK
jgi:hypothetical protein